MVPYEMKDIRMVKIGDMCIDISDHPEIMEFTYDEEAVQEYIDEQCRPVIDYANCKAHFTIRINRITAFKLAGAWDWVAENCPNKRVAHLMKYHKDDRVKYKNFKHAVKIIGRILEDRS